MKTLSKLKMNGENNQPKVLSREKMKQITGGYYYCTVKCEDGSSYWREFGSPYCENSEFFVQYCTQRRSKIETCSCTA